MSQSHETIIASEPRHLYRALLNPEDLHAWWGCTAVIEARIGGNWIGGWGQGEGGLGHQTVLFGQVAGLEPDQLVTLIIGGAQIDFQLAGDAQGTKVTLAITAATPEEEATMLQSWSDAVDNMKAWAEQNHKFTPAAPAVKPGIEALGGPLPPPAAAPTPAPQPAASPTPPGGEPSGGSDPFKAMAAMSGGEVTVVDEGGFGVTDPNAVVKSWSKEQGFGYATHAQLGDVVFDYDGCDFEPAPGDEVLLLVIGKRYDGKPKIKRIACPSKGSNIKL